MKTKSMLKKRHLSLTNRSLMGYTVFFLGTCLGFVAGINAVLSFKYGSPFLDHNLALLFIVFLAYLISYSFMTRDSRQKQTQVRHH